MTSFKYVVLLLAVHAAQGQAALLQNQEQEYGIGFDLTPSYATAAVSFANGSNVAIARVDGNVEWRNMMADISWHEQGNLWKSRMESHTGILANMLKELVLASEQRLGQRPTAASASLPGRNIVARRGTPVADLVRAAFSAASLGYIEIIRFSYFGEPLLYPENVQLAGHGFGLCQPYTSSRRCLEDEEQFRNLTREAYYMVGYYSNELEVIATTPTVLAYGITPDPYVDYRLGVEARYKNPHEDFYWEEVRQLLSKPLIRGMLQLPSKVILYGDHSKDEKFVAIVKEVLSTFLGDHDMPVWVEDGTDPVFVGAMGAAEFAKRKPYWSRTSFIGPKTDL